jgi:uncharacterized glyoxalase superfamily protein PhnB
MCAFFISSDIIKVRIYVKEGRMSKVIPFIFLEDAQAALTLYKLAFNGSIEGPITDLGEQTGNEGLNGKIAHASLNILGSTLFIGEATDANKGQQSFLAIECDTIDQVIQAYDILSEEAVIHMPLDEETYAFSLVDRFGVSFLVYQK